MSSKRDARIAEAISLGLGTDFTGVHTTKITHMIKRHNALLPSLGSTLGSPSTLDASVIGEPSTLDASVIGEPSTLDASVIGELQSPRVILKCMRVGSKLRIRFHSFINENGVTFTNVYNDKYNCTFPKDIRVAGRYYEIPHHDISLNRGNTSPFYNIKKSNIKILSSEPETRILTTAEKLANLTVYKNVEECCICMCSDPNTVFIPCGHQCVCSDCFDILKKTKYNPPCPLCRRPVTDSIII